MLEVLFFPLSAFLLNQVARLEACGMLLFQDAWWSAKSDGKPRFMTTWVYPSKMSQTESENIFFPASRIPTEKNIHWKMQLCSLVGHGFQASGYCDLEPKKSELLGATLWGPMPIQRPLFKRTETRPLGLRCWLTEGKWTAGTGSGFKKVFVFVNPLHERKSEIQRRNIHHTS